MIINGVSRLEYKDLPETYDNRWNNKSYNRNPIFSLTKMMDAFMGNLNNNHVINLHDNDEELVLSVDMEGFDPRDLDVTVHGNSVIIKGDSRREEIQDRPGHYFAMQSYNSLYQTIPLPAQIKPEKTIARFDNGNLELTMLKGKTTVRNFKPLIEFSDKTLLN